MISLPVLVIFLALIAAYLSGVSFTTSGIPTMSGKTGNGSSSRSMPRQGGSHAIHF
jgi:hypothetical protein